MDMIELGQTKERVSRLALGCMLMGTRTDEATSVAMLDRYAEAGGTFLDTANCYMWWHRPGGPGSQDRRDSRGGHSEELLGRWLARTGRRDEMFVATKGGGMVRDQAGVWTADGSPDWARVRFEGAGARTLRDAVDASLRRLRTDRIDLYYVHVDDRTTPLEETLAELDAIVTAGKVRHLGWSNVRTWRLERIRQLCERYGWAAPAALQQRHSYLRPRAGHDEASTVDGEQLDYLRAHEDLTLVAYSPILQGAYDDAVKRSTSEFTRRYSGPDADARLSVLAQVAGEVGATHGQVVLAWLMASTGPQVVPLAGPRTLDQFHTVLAALGVRLTADHVERLNRAGDPV